MGQSRSTQLKATTLQVLAFSRQPTNLLGVCRLPVYVCGYNCNHEFNVFPKNTTDTQLILGQPWQRSFNCTLKWSKNAARITHKAQKLLIPFTISNTTSSTPTKDGEIAQEDSTSLNNGLNSSREETKVSRPESIGQTKPYLTTKPTKTKHNKPIWIPKTLLQAQTS